MSQNHNKLFHRPALWILCHPFMWERRLAAGWLPTLGTWKTKHGPRGAPSFRGLFRVLIWKGWEGWRIGCFCPAPHPSWGTPQVRSSIVSKLSHLSQSPHWDSFLDGQGMNESSMPLWILGFLHDYFWGRVFLSALPESLEITCKRYRVLDFILQSEPESLKMEFRSLRSLDDFNAHLLRPWKSQLVFDHPP